MLFLGWPWLLWLLFLILGFCFGLLLCWCCRRRLYKMMGIEQSQFDDAASESGDAAAQPLLAGAKGDGYGTAGAGASADVNVNMGGGASGAAGADVNVVVDIGAAGRGGSSSTTVNNVTLLAGGAAYSGYTDVAMAPVAAASSKSFLTRAVGPDVQTEDVGVGTESLAAGSGSDRYRLRGYGAPPPPPPPPPPLPATPGDGSASRMRERASGPDVPGLTVSGSMPGDDKACVPCIPTKKANRWNR